MILEYMYQQPASSNGLLSTCHHQHSASLTCLTKSRHQHFAPFTCLAGSRSSRAIYHGSLCSQHVAQHNILINPAFLPSIQSNIHQCCRASQSADKSNINSSNDNPAEDEKNLSVFQRFKRAYKEHGKVLIAVHVATSVMWFSSFFYAAKCGFDVIPWLEKVGASETIIKPFQSSGVGDIALAYLMYKIATPARYTVTLGGTNFAIKYMRKTGKMERVPEGDKLRELYRDQRTKLRDDMDKRSRKSKPGKIGVREKTDED